MKNEEFEAIHREIQKDFQDMAKAYSRFIMRVNANLQDMRDLIDEQRAMESGDIRGNTDSGIADITDSQ